MKSIVLVADNQLQLASDTPEPEVGPGEVKVRVLAGGVCGSDLSVIHGGREIPRHPWTIGHEGGGEIVEVAPDVVGLEVGDRVVIEPNFACMRCQWCLRGETKMCVDRAILGINIPGLFSEFVVVPARFAWKVPAATAKSVLASLEPSVVAHVAVQRYLNDASADARVLVIGAGSQGLIVTTLVAQSGRTPAVSEPNAEKLATAIRHGGRDATETPDARYDLVFETSGAPAGLRGAIDRAEKLGVLCVIGQTSRATDIISQTIVQNELHINGQLIYNHPVDFAAAIASLGDGTLDPTIALREPVSATQAITDMLAAAELDGKIWIDFEEWK